jgi:hypothetical protein
VSVRLYENGANLVRMSINHPKPTALDPLARARRHAQLAAQLADESDAVRADDLRPALARDLSLTAQAHAFASLALTQLNPPARYRPGGAQTRTAFKGGQS